MTCTVIFHYMSSFSLARERNKGNSSERREMSREWSDVLNKLCLYLLTKKFPEMSSALDWALLPGLNSNKQGSISFSFFYLFKIFISLSLSCGKSNKHSLCGSRRQRRNFIKEKPLAIETLLTERWKRDTFYATRHFSQKKRERIPSSRCSFGLNNIWWLKMYKHKRGKNK